MPLKPKVLEDMKREYKRIVQAGQNVHNVEMEEDKQAKARSAMERVPSGAVVDYFDITSARRLSEDANYRTELQKVVDMIQGRPVEPDSVAARDEERMKAAALLKLSFPGADWSKVNMMALATRPDVYRIMVTALQEIKQNTAIEPSGIFGRSKPISRSDALVAGVGVAVAGGLTTAAFTVLLPVVLGYGMIASAVMGFLSGSAVVKTPAAKSAVTIPSPGARSAPASRPAPAVPVP
jgi:hypothetical protein